MKNRKIGNILLVISCVAVAASLLFAVKYLSGVVIRYYDNERIICLDAGHGGSDSGARSADGKRLEKDDNLRLTLKIKAELEKRGVKVVLTRDDDSTVSLANRCKKANRRRCDLFLAVHRNSSEKGSGFEAWISQIPKGREKKTAAGLTEKLSEISSLADRGVHRGFRDSSAKDYYVNANTNMPSILLEVGFITSEADNKMFDRDIDRYAAAIAEIAAEAV